VTEAERLRRRDIGGETGVERQMGDIKEERHTKDGWKETENR
jgi:hypothetical protein